MAADSISVFFKTDTYVDFESPIIRETANDLLKGAHTREEKLHRAYEFVRDDIPHSFDMPTDIITAKASDTLKHRTGICHAKANLLAALLRSQGIPAGFCFQRTTIADDDSQGYCVHAFNAVYLSDRWIKVDARGNTGSINAQISYGEPQLAFPVRPQYDEYLWEGIYAEPHKETMQMLERVKSVEEIRQQIPDTVKLTPDFAEAVVS